MSPPGMLCVTMQPKPELLEAQFHEWYNNEHGPTRLRLPQIFTNGLRYRQIDGKEPIYLAAYDVTAMSHLETETYTTLRANRSPREAQTIGQVAVNRYFWDLVTAKQAPLFIPIEKLTNDEAEGLALVVVQIELKGEAAQAEAEVLKWYKEEHIDMLSKVPGWLRSRVFRTSTLESGSPTHIWALHDYTKENGLGGHEFKAATSTPWKDEVTSKYANIKDRRVFGLFYVFGPAPRDLSSLSQLPAETSSFKAADAKTTTTNDPQPIITSYITTPDGLSIPYQLEGNPDPKAPVIAFCNSLLTSLHMWDKFVAILKEKRPQYQILRYDTRGRHSIPSPTPVTLDKVSDDLSYLLEALRIPKLNTLIGVSMGGATTLKFVLKYPERLAKFVACDFNVNSSAANTEAWKGRISIAETPLEDGSPGIEKLAGQTVERWFHPNTMSKTETVQWITEQVATNDIEGFRYGCQALWDYDMKAEMKDCQVPGLLVVGEGDGKGALVKAMDGFKANLGAKGSDLAIVPEAGHLPMCENPEGFWKAIESFI
ncbi:Alpha/Beta hydrolase protein [Truncatella angustata]|uniref:Alpha/Beta hydrolase protein n=1 Tax=Truncatella angustata TaxID=152316 RepID=A0A9P8ZUA6_9PEZI|nr:Alpha/Beta hydrolase protein [Truncatella angustata]KAH6651659.1 Alpha/Beta hydrolase protein [Truncatella angustata]